jgi:hypothetical protein
MIVKIKPDSRGLDTAIQEKSKRFNGALDGRFKPGHDNRERFRKKGRCQPFRLAAALNRSRDLSVGRVLKDLCENSQAQRYKQRKRAVSHQNRCDLRNVYMRKIAQSNDYGDDNGDKPKQITKPHDSPRSLVSTHTRSSGFRR